MRFGYMEFHGFHGNPLCDFKECGVCTKYSYLGRNSSKNIKLGTKLILGHSSFNKWLDMQIIEYPYSLILMKTLEMR